MTPGSSFDRSLLERDGKLIENWYIACLASELQGARPLARVVYDTPLVLFRGKDGEPFALLDRCLHRGVKLSEGGGCQDGQISCPYHGWRYNGRGEVTAVPSEGDAFRSVKGTLRGFRAVEQDGVIWVWMGEGEPRDALPPWRFPNYDDRTWSRYFMITDFDNEVTHLCENFMDVPHTVFVHRGWFRNRAMKKVPMTLDVRDGSVLVTYHQKGDSIGFTGRILNPSGRPMTHTDRYVFPNITRVDYGFGPDHAFIINSQCTPVGTLKSRVYTYISFKIGRWTPLFHGFMRFYTRQVIEQDVKIMRNQSEAFRSWPVDRFKSTDADEVHLAIERLRELGTEGSPEVFRLQKSKEKVFWI